jgi:hypothetical protein
LDLTPLKLAATFLPRICSNGQAVSDRGISRNRLQILARIGLAALNRDEALVLDPVQCGLSF